MPTEKYNFLISEAIGLPNDEFLSKILLSFFLYVYISIYNEDSISVVKKISVDIIQNENINKITYRTMWLWKKYNVTGKIQKINTFHPYIQKSRKIEKEDFLLVIC